MPKFITSNNLSKLNGITHGFFTRSGGCSEGIYESLNCGAGSDDNPENVRKNRFLAAQSLGLVNEECLYSLYQIHSNKVVVLDDIPSKRYEADAMVTATRGIALGILTADCTPILFADSQNGIIGAAHAGWKGAVSGVMENTIEQMEKLGANRGDIVAAIGPTIAQESYEVGPEFYDRILEEKKANSMFFVPSVKSGHYMFNLPLYVACRLEKAGIKSIEDCTLDTCADRDNFFSYRRSCLEGGNGYGRNLSVITIA
jgi:polyphenol oxidase